LLFPELSHESVPFGMIWYFTYMSLMSWYPRTVAGELNTTLLCLSIRLPPCAHTTAMMSSLLSFPGDVPSAIP